MSEINIQEENILTNKSFLLDPLSVIIKLAILSKKNVGTKVCVHNNSLFIQEIGIFQPLVRYFYKNSKVDIQYLYNPIEWACAYFLSKKQVENNPSIKNLFVFAQKGIEALIETYKKYTLIIHNLYLYYNIISNYTSNEHKINKNLFIKDNLSSFYTQELVSKLNSLWTEDRIKIVLNMIEYVEKEKGNNDKSVKCLEEFMVNIDSEVYDILKKQ